MGTPTCAANTKVPVRIMFGVIASLTTAVAVAKQQPEAPSSSLPGEGMSVAGRAVEGDVSYRETGFGRGFVADDEGERITYPTEGHLLPERGTVELWVEIADSVDDGMEWNPLVVAQETPYWPLRGLIVQFVRDTTAIAFVAGDPKKEGLMGLIDWKKGETHYIAATWGDDGMRLYGDGKRIARSSKSPDLEALPEKLSVGGYIWPQATHPSNTVIDELRISSVERSPDEIAAVFDARKPFRADEHTLLVDHFDEER